MRVMMFMDGDVPVLWINGVQVKLSAKEFDALVGDMKFCMGGVNVTA